MLAVFAALALQASTAAAPTPATVAPADVAPAAVAPVAAPAMTPADELVELQRVYAESCDTRAYGTYDDICSNLADQIARFRREMRHDHARTPKPAATTTTTTIPAASPSPK